MNSKCFLPSCDHRLKSSCPLLFLLYTSFFLFLQLLASSLLCMWPNSDLNLRWMLFNLGPAKSHRINPTLLSTSNFLTFAWRDPMKLFVSGQLCLLILYENSPRYVKSFPVPYSSCLLASLILFQISAGRAGESEKCWTRASDSSEWGGWRHNRSHPFSSVSLISLFLVSPLSLSLFIFLNFGFQFLPVTWHSCSTW